MSGRGDLTDYGLPEEARVLAKDLAAATTVPVVAVLGNHDYESGEVDQVKAILGEAGVHILDGDACEIQGVGFAGAKDLGGGFGERALQPWGEDLIKRFVRETVDEALKLESALAKLRSTQRVALLHGHAHHGQIEGRTRGQVPVYNVCLHLLLAAAPERRPFRLSSPRRGHASRPFSASPISRRWETARRNSSWRISCRASRCPSGGC